MNNDPFYESIFGDGRERSPPPGSWSHHPDNDEPVTSGPSYTYNRASDQPPSNTTASDNSTQTPNPAFSQDRARQRRQQTPKQCRICFDVDTVDAPDPELGRLISPCKCRGSSKYVHEGCLRAWRTQSANDASFYKCPTCKFEYKFRRLRFAQIVASAAMQIGITVLILLITVYLLGFVSDALINSYVDPYFSDTGSFFMINGFSLYGSPVRNRGARIVRPIPARSGLVDHMLRGLSAVGLLSFLKVIFVSPIWLRYIFGHGGGAARQGRDRIGQIGWVIIMLGVINFLIFVYKIVRRKTKGILDGIAEGVVDIQEDDEEVAEDGVKED